MSSAGQRRYWQLYQRCRASGYTAGDLSGATSAELERKLQRASGEPMRDPTRAERIAFDRAARELERQRYDLYTAACRDRGAEPISWRAWRAADQPTQPLVNRR